MSNEISVFELSDRLDAQQIAEADTAVRQALFHDIRGKKQLSYAGIKWIAIMMAQQGQPLKLVGDPQIRLDKDEPDNEERWFWRSTIVVRNESTGLETFGVAESPYIFDGRYDTFGRTKSASKAERNALRKQIPELMLQQMQQAAETGKIPQQSTGTRSSSGASSLSSTCSISWSSKEEKQRVEKSACKCDTPTPGHTIRAGKLAGQSLCRVCNSIILVQHQEVLA